MATRIEYRFTCTLKHGLHARPASMAAEVARRFAADITIVKEGEGTPVDAKSVLSIVGLDVKMGDVCVVVGAGGDAAAAIAAFKALVEGPLGEGDELPAADSVDSSTAVEARLPMGLRDLAIKHAPGRSVCAGVGIGVAVPAAGLSLPPEARAVRATSASRELDDAQRAVADVREELRRRASAAGPRFEADLLRAHAGIADDPALWSEIQRRIEAGATAPQGVVDAGERFAAHLRTASTAYIRDRAIDVQDVCMQLVDRLLGGAAASTQVRLQRDSVVFAEALTANQLLHMDRSLLKGLVLGRVGATSHTVILARSLRIPTLIDVDDARSAANPGEHVVVDADGGFVITQVGPEVRRYYERERRTRLRRTARLVPSAQKPAITSDGVRLEVGTNASTPEEVATAIADGADGVGLLRTELLFLDRAAAPTEDEQFEAYSAVVAAAGGRPVIIRTFDIGGDKPAAYLRMPHEENPFLGVRGLRLYERNAGLLRSQLRAIIRASARGPVKVMAPMVATPAEAAWFKSKVREVQAELRSAGGQFDPAMPVGVMVEIPACALTMNELCDEVEFFSIGTNDLCQYWMAVDRGNPGVATLYNPRQPSFIRLLRTIVQAAKDRGRWIGICGEMAGDRLNLPLMIGLGVDEISVAPGDVMPLKSAVRDSSVERCREAIDQAVACRDAVAVETVLRAVAAGSGASEPVLAAELIEIGLDAATKTEAITSLVDLVLIAGRTDRPREVEEAVWAREATYSTGLGYGFAVPHCKTDAVRSPTLAVARLAAPVDWGSMDGQPVSVVMLLAIPASDTTGAHMKVFAKLARKLMHEEFRDAVRAAGSAMEIELKLREELGIE